MARFPSSFKTRAPYNALCFLDPRNIDIFFESEEELASVFKTIKDDKIYELLRREEMDEENYEQQLTAPTLVVQSTSRREELLARRMSLDEDRVRREEGPGADSVGQKIDKEIVQ
jgi:hypothetical protein